MSDNQKREERAFDALIVSQMRRERDIEELGDLPALTADELAMLESIPDDFIEVMWQQACDGERPILHVAEEDCAIVGVGDGFSFGMDRSTDMSPEDKEKLDAAREQAREELKKRMNPEENKDA